ncbi:TetR/AcrR family transcriptional regulator [Amycolatopsis sp. NPDC051372]|uniref:TetR/AcrR family transcriptional regulator n=1 Tax=Amycolatopsis sp. NPDC051372 TaxID=3155669 RepID=UPI00341CF8E1
MSSTTGLVKTPQQVRSKRSLALVLEAARVVLDRDGIHDFTMTGVATEAGVSIGGIYRRFESKDALLRVVKDREFTRVEEALAARLGAAQPSLVAVVREFVTCLVEEFSAAERLFQSLMAASGTDEEMHARGVAWLDTVFEAFRTAAMRDAAAIRHEDPDVALRMAFQLISGVLLRRPVSGTYGGEVFTGTWEQASVELQTAALAYLTAGGTAKASRKAASKKTAATRRS